MKKTLSLIVAFCMIFSLAAVAEGVSFDVKKSPFANTISNQQAFSLDIYGDYCYVSARAGGVQIFDISDINNITNIITDNPDLSAEMQTDGNNVKVYNGYLYAGFTGQLAKFSLQNPASPVLTASLSDIPAGIAMAFSGNLMFVTRNSNGALYICDISEETLEIKRTISTDSALGKHRAVYVRGDYLYISCAKGLRIFDISSGNADDVTEVVSLSLDTSNINDICVSDKAIFLSDWGTRVLYIVDLTTAKPLSELTS